MSRLLAMTLLALSIAPVSAQFENVGTISFPTSGSPAAQQHFLRGVAILHSFGWKQAITEFQAAQKLQPDFAMAYWGETLCYNHPLQAEQDGKTPREVLARLYPDAVLATREDAMAFGLNSVSDGRHVFVSPGATALAARLADRGYVPVPVDLSEFHKAGGGIKCCTQEIRS